MTDEDIDDIAATLDDGSFFDDRLRASAQVAALITTLRQRNAQLARPQAGHGPTWITHLETDDDSRHGWDQDSGMPGVGLFANALQVWAMARNRTVTVNDAAIAFNVAPALIRQAVDWHHWMFIGAADAIEHEGE